jgi:lysophospholipase L1-like esterase
MIGETCGADCVKEAVSGTTLADIGAKSYVSRLKAKGAALRPDLFVCQLSTNDATRGIAIGEVECAIRTIVEYVAATFACPIVFYTGTYFESAAYAEMVALLYRLQEEYRFAILDLYHDEDMRGVSQEDYERYMRDPIHPTLVGYRAWWTPKFIAFFERLPE